MEEQMHAPHTLRRFGVAPLLVAIVAVTAAGFTHFSRTDASSQHERYTADLVALNPDIGPGPVDGKATISVDGDTIRVHLNARNVAPGIAHAMHIHAAAHCPDANDDANNDGVVDVIEGLPDYGPILVPLDSDLTTQAAGTFPTASNGGALHYHQHDDFQAMLNDLMAVDPNTGDAVIKLAPGEALHLAGRHIVVHGVAADTPLPATAASLGTAPAQATLPIACGEITAK
jgi:hypothetical protein